MIAAMGLALFIICLFIFGIGTTFAVIMVLTIMGMMSR